VREAIAVKHVLLTNPLLIGVEYGILRDFEDEIVRITGAERVEGPVRKLPTPFNNRLQHGTRYASLRRFVPKKRHHIEADVLWVVLMGPENFTLDLFDTWDEGVGTKILYIFDTFECHLSSIQRVLKSAHWDFTFTSFEGAKAYLEQHTDRAWHLVRQGVKLDRFKPSQKEDRAIDFCSYGRQLTSVHESIKRYCATNGKYYDFNTTVPILDASVSPQDSYRKYAWHLSHSWFNFCWPITLTHPGKVRTFSPISPRYFEAAASGNVMLGCTPGESGFNDLFGRDAVIDIDYRRDDLMDIWESLYRDRNKYLDAALERRSALAHKWTWESRVHQILEATQLESSQNPQSAIRNPQSAIQRCL
jgi:hypothetical protein